MFDFLKEKSCKFKEWPAFENYIDYVRGCKHKIEYTDLNSEIYLDFIYFFGFKGVIYM